MRVKDAPRDALKESTMRDICVTDMESFDAVHGFISSSALKPFYAAVSMPSIVDYLLRRHASSLMPPLIRD